MWLLLQVPELGFNVGECIGRPFSFGHRLRNPCATPKTAVMSRQAVYRQIVETVAKKQPALHVFDPLPYLCDADSCFGILGGKVLYRDDDHLSREGSAFVAAKIPFD